MSNLLTGGGAEHLWAGDVIDELPIKEDRWILTPRQERATQIAGLLIAHAIVGVSRFVRWGTRRLRAAVEQLAEQGAES